jgi:hypothetical protein
MAKDFLEYRFDTDTVIYPSNYNPDKLNLGYLMKKGVDTENKLYISPLEPVFIRGWEVNGNDTIGSLSSVKYNDNTIWLFYVNPLAGGGIKRIYMAEYNISANTINQLGSIYSSLNNNTSHDIRSLRSTLDFHTGGTVFVSFSAVTGFGTQWVNNGVCAGNRIGFGSTNPAEITTWYEVLSVNNNTSITIRRGVTTDGITTNLNYLPGTPYVIEDLRLLYGNYAGLQNTVRGFVILKGLRKEIFNSTITTIPAATTVDNQRATYRLVDSTGGIYSTSPLGVALENKISLSEQYAYVLNYCNVASCSSASFLKFNVRANLTGLTSSYSNAAYVLGTGTQSTASPYSTTNLFDPITNDTNNIYLTQTTRVSRIPMSAITANSTTFIVNQMVENPPGGVNTLTLTNNMENSIYLPTINRLYINNQAGFKNYITPYLSGSSQFERTLLINDRIQQSTYLDFNFNYLTPHTIGTQFYSSNNSGISFLVRYSSDNNNLIYALPLEADKDYSDTTKAFVITPKITTLSAVTYDNIYVESTNTWGNDKFLFPREIFDTYYRVSGITNDSGVWTLISQNGSMSGITSNEIQFKFTFRTIGNYCIPSRIHGITLSYSANTQPISTSFYEPSLQNTNISSNIFSWRQRDNFESNIPNLKLDIYNISNNNLLLSDSVNDSSNGIWQYSIDGITWDSWSSSADNPGNYIRYSATTLSASGIKVKPILYI